MDLNIHHICNMKYDPKIGTEQEAAKHKNFPKNEIFQETSQELRMLSRSLSTSVY